jgi:hypothetical protein
LWCAQRERREITVTVNRRLHRDGLGILFLVYLALSLSYSRDSLRQFQNTKRLSHLKAICRCNVIYTNFIRSTIHHFALPVRTKAGLARAYPWTLFPKDYSITETEGKGTANNASRRVNTYCCSSRTIDLFLYMLFFVHLQLFFALTVTVNLEDLTGNTYCCSPRTTDLFLYKLFFVHLQLFFALRVRGNDSIRYSNRGSKPARGQRRSQSHNHHHQMP